MHSDPPASERLTVRDLFWAFFQIGVSGFGGVLPWARRVLVEKRRWLTEDQFTDALSVCSALPGPNIVNLSVSFGARHAGATGAIAGFCGLMLAPFAIVMVLGVIYTSYGQIPQVESAFRGMSAVGAGLLVAAGLKLASSPRLRNALCVFGVAMFVLIAFLRVPLVAALAVLGPCAVFAACKRDKADSGT